MGDGKLKVSLHCAMLAVSWRCTTLRWSTVLWLLPLSRSLRPSIMSRPCGTGPVMIRWVLSVSLSLSLHSLLTFLFLSLFLFSLSLFLLPLSHSVSLSRARTHTHTHTHTLSLSLSLNLNLSFWKCTHKALVPVVIVVSHM